MTVRGSSPTKTCRECGEEKPREEFYEQSGRCKVCCRAAARAWRLAHLDHARELQRRRHRLHPEIQKARSRKHYLENTEKMKARAVEYQRAHPETRREQVRRRRARIRGVTVEQVNYTRIRRREGDYCYLCGRPLGSSSVDFDHVVPISRGGAHASYNIRPTHSSCNRRKAGRLVEECDWVVLAALLL